MNEPQNMNSNDVSDLLAEYQAAHDSAALFDISCRDEIRLTGDDRSTFLQGFCTNDINKLQPGQGCEAFLTSIQGKTLGHIFVFAEPDQLVIDTNTGAAEIVIPHLDRYLITEDVTIENVTASRKLFYLTGPQAAALLENYNPQIAGLALNGHMQIENEGNCFHVRKVDWFKQPGFQISLEQDKAYEFKKQLINSGATFAGHQTWETLRIESGLPEYGVDFNSENLAQEIDRTDSAISFNKGCYLGQEPIARIDAIGHVNRLLCQLKISGTIESTESLTQENLICTNDSEKSLGQITSAARLPQITNAEPVVVAIATVRREIAEPGTSVIVKTDSGNYPAIIE